MPNRVIREGFLDDEKINSLTEDEQMLFIRLTLVVDDFGCWWGRPEMIRSRCYPVTDKCLTVVRQSLDNLHKAGLIMIYEVSGKQYINVPNFRQRLRKMVSKFPKPPEISTYSPPCQTNVRQPSDNCQQSDALNPESESGIRIRKDSLPPASPSVQDVPEKPKRQVKQNPWFDAVVEVFDFKALVSTKSGPAQIGRLASDFKAMCEVEGKDHTEISRMAEKYKVANPGKPLNPYFLKTAWAQLKNTGSTGKPVSDLFKSSMALNQKKELSNV